MRGARGRRSSAWRWCSVELLDERLTTAQGERLLISMDTSRKKRKGLIDQVAAQLILQSYLDAKYPR